MEVNNYYALRYFEFWYQGYKARPGRNFHNSKGV